MLIAAFLIIVFVSAIALLVNTALSINQNIQTTGSASMMPKDTMIPTEDYFNNCSNNWTFVSCTNGQCYADGKPIPITGYLTK